MKKLNSSLLLAALLAGCQLQMRPLPGPVDFPRSEPPGERMLGKGEGPTERKMAVSAVAAAPAARPALPAAPVPTAITVDDEPVSIAIEQTALPMFVQILYGSVLKVPYTLDPTVTSRTDPVTFKTSQALPRSKVLQLADTLLRSYGLTAQEFGGLVRIAPVGATALTSIPAIRRSEGDVGLAANDQRQVFHYIETSVVRAAEMSQWLKQMLGTRVTLYEDNQNAFLLAGSTGDVRAALEVIRALDQPRMRGRFARRLTPANAAAPELAARLSEVLTAQGYSTALTASGSATVQILPIPSIGSIVVFAGTEAVLEHVVRWARELDQSPKNASTNNALFTYPVRFADAQDLARTLSELLGGVGGASVPAAAQGSPVGGAPAAAARSSSGGRVVVNNATNTLIFRGTNAEEQQQIRQLLLELDRPTKSAMIEVVVAELSVGALQRLGVQWTHNGLTSLTPARSATLGGSGLSISYTNAARDILAAIDALASDSNARVLSNPKVMARNGETASIQVGSEVPIVTTQQSTSVNGSPFPWRRHRRRAPADPIPFDRRDPERAAGDQFGEPPGSGRFAGGELAGSDRDRGQQQPDHLDAAHQHQALAARWLDGAAGGLDLAELEPFQERRAPAQGHSADRSGVSQSVRARRRARVARDDHPLCDQRRFRGRGNLRGGSAQLRRLGSGIEERQGGQAAGDPNHRTCRASAIVPTGR
jgi:general secretion pathway protein D